MLGGHPGIAPGSYAMEVVALAWSPDSRSVASGSLDRTVRVWAVVARRQEQVLTGPEQGITSVTWSPDGSRIAAGTYQGKVWVWQAATGRREAVLEANRGET